MIERRNNQQGVSGLGYKEKKMSQDKTPKRRLSSNETLVPLLDPELKIWIKVVRPSRASLTYERME